MQAPEGPLCVHGLLYLKLASQSLGHDRGQTGATVLVLFVGHWCSSRAPATAKYTSRETFPQCDISYTYTLVIILKKLSQAKLKFAL